jgi:hypothetical protein
VVSDLSAFHRITDASGLDARTFVMLAERLPAYSGAVQASFRRWAAEAEEEGEEYQAPRQAGNGQALGSSFDEQWARATPALAGQAAETEAQILSMMTGAAR